MPVLFVRIGWMRFYGGPVPGDGQPIGGGAYCENNIGHEAYNFRVANGHLYGYFQPPNPPYQVNLGRIGPEAAAADSLDQVLVVFVATRPVERGQVIVGWYRDAVVFREYVDNLPDRPEVNGHFCSAASRNCVLLPEENRTFIIPRGRNAMGMSNVCYPLDQDGEPRNFEWMQDALNFIDNYQGRNPSAGPEADAEEEIAAVIEAELARSQCQGFARTPHERKAIEDHAMAAATKYFEDKHFVVEDVHLSCPYDLLCRRNEIELHVEVKGTTTNGDKVILTNNEVKHACDPGNSCVLFVRHSIILQGRRATGGQSVLRDPWQLQQAHLTPVCYTYSLR